MTPPDTGSVPGGSAARRRQETKICRLVICAVVVIGVVALAFVQPWAAGPIHPTQSVRYLGVYEPDAPATYAGVDQFAQAIGRQPNLVAYYSRWLSAVPSPPSPPRRPSMAR